MVLRDQKIISHMPLLAVALLLGLTDDDDDDVLMKCVHVCVFVCVSKVERGRERERASER